MSDKDRSIISDKLLIEKTGHNLEYWFGKLDDAGAKKETPSGIYKLTCATGLEKLIGEWNCGLVSTAYQWSRNLRKRGEKKDGFEISVSRTFNVPVELLFAHWTDDKLRTKWMKRPVTFTRSTPNRSIRAKSESGSRISVEFYSKGKDKTQVVVQEMKLADEEAAATQRTLWQESLQSLGDNALS